MSDIISYARVLDRRPERLRSDRAAEGCRRDQTTVREAERRARKNGWARVSAARIQKSPSPVLAEDGNWHSCYAARQTDTTQ